LKRDAVERERTGSFVGVDGGCLTSKSSVFSQCKIVIRQERKRCR